MHNFYIFEIGIQRSFILTQQLATVYLITYQLDV